MIPNRNHTPRFLLLIDVNAATVKRFADKKQVNDAQLSLPLTEGVFEELEAFRIFGPSSFYQGGP